MPRPNKGEKTPGSGRKKGTPNKRRSVLEACEQVGIDPFQEMAKVAAGKHENAMLMEYQFDAIKELCQYLEPKKKAIEHSGEVNQRLIEEAERLQGLTKEDLKKVIQEELKK